VAGVPFVDVLTTMLDETIPLTVVEVCRFCMTSTFPYCHCPGLAPCRLFLLVYLFACLLATPFNLAVSLTSGVQYEEWGNPNDKTYYDYIRSYSPVDQVYYTKGPYPPILIKGRTSLSWAPCCTVMSHLRVPSLR
jgi:hypothetical protein